MEDNSLLGLLIHLLSGDHRKRESYILPGATKEEAQARTRYAIEGFKDVSYGRRFLSISDPVSEKCDIIMFRG